MPQQEDVLRAMTPAQRLHAANALVGSARNLKAMAIRREHPGWDEQQVARAVRETFLYATT